MNDKIEKTFEETFDEIYDKAVLHCQRILEGEYERMKIMSKSDTYCSGRIKHLIDSLEKLKSTNED